MPERRVANWGNYPSIEATVEEFSDPERVREYILSHSSLIARGNGRCYGDSALNENILSTLRLNRFLEFDTEAGILECEAGVLLSDILDVIVPRGYFLPVTPGTKYVTVGGAIAADVHGKNHHREGSFSNHLIEFTLIDPSGGIKKCSRDENADDFWNTCGGMGLTGVVLSARFQLKKVESSYITEITKRAKQLEAVMEMFEEHHDATYSVAWIDCFASGRNVGRSVLRLGEHCLKDDLPMALRSSPFDRPRKRGASVPMFLPSWTINQLTVKGMNFAYYHKHPSSEHSSVISLDQFFYPLDSISNWNRAYGKRGFLQYQFVIPKENASGNLRKILGLIQHSGQGSPLAVLKLFGKPDPMAVMSFPIEGYTLALDFKVSKNVFGFLDLLDEVVAEAGGRIYLAKDARMSSKMFRSSYSKVVASGKMNSLQSRRLGI